MPSDSSKRIKSTLSLLRVRSTFRNDSEEYVTKSDFSELQNNIGHMFDLLQERIDMSQDDVKHTSEEYGQMTHSHTQQSEE